MDSIQPCLRLDFHYDLVLNEEIDTVGGFEALSAEMSRQRHLPLHLQATTPQEKSKALLVTRLQQPRPELTVHRDCIPDNYLGDLIDRPHSAPSQSSAPSAIESVREGCNATKADSVRERCHATTLEAIAG
ncbi:MAG TPA: hypothetical protein VK933_05240 [Longimicrobiales bacterium]|nr:hypothetical protein [Longimicrobiales bacterium]